MLQQNPICEKVNICASNHNLQPKCDDSNSNGSAILRYYFVLVLLRLEIKKRHVFYFLPGICTPWMIDGVI